MKRFLAILLLVAFAGCGGAAGSVPSRSTQAVATKLDVRVTIHVPRKKHRRGHYVSPSTQSGTLQVTPGTGCTQCTATFTSNFGLTQSSPNCQSSATTSGLTCSIPLTLHPGTYVGSMTLYDGPLAGNAPTGNQLSANQAFSIPVAAGAANAPSITLDGVPSAVNFISLGGVNLPFSNLFDATLFEPPVFGSGRILIVAYDRDSNTILGPGSPTFTFSSAGGFTVTQVGTNIYLVTAPSHPVSGTFTTKLTISSPACGSPAAMCSAIDAYRLRFAMPTIAAIAEANAVVLTSVAGTDTTIATITQGVAGPSALAFDSSGDLFVANSTTSTVTEYAPPYTGAPIATIGNSLSTPSAMIIDHSGNLFVANAGNGSISAFPFSNYLTASPTNTPVLATPKALALDSQGRLWVAAGGHLYRLPTPLTVPGADQALDVTTPTSIALDASNDVFATSGTSIAEFDVSGSAYVSGTGASGITGLSAIAAFNDAAAHGQINALGAASSTGDAIFYELELPGILVNPARNYVEQMTTASFDQYGYLWGLQPGLGAEAWNPYELTLNFITNSSASAALAVYPGP